MVMVQSKKERRLENLRGKQPIGIAASSASFALLSLPATMGTERLVIDLGSPLVIQCAALAELKAGRPSHHTNATRFTDLWPSFRSGQPILPSVT
ncbi:hypothetical protein M422DRAFT_245519 [Sphaerobolus stellatus SS14]|nr:hypothetical protein M422DRAFT_245519 [Sphaerobolus stellatus SS14]